MRKLLVLLIAVPLLVFGCKKEEVAGIAEVPADTAASAPAPRGEQAAGFVTGVEKRAPATPAIPRKLIRTVSLQLEVRDTEETARKVEALVTRLGGYVESSSGERRNEVLYYQMAVRVPVQRLDEALTAIRSMASRVNREQRSIEDVTSQYIDLDARMRTLKATEAELQALLAESRQRGRKVEDIMAVYRELTEIRSQIEQIQAQLNSFDRLASFSTIRLELVPTEGAKPVAETGWRPGNTLRSSFRMLVAFLRWLVDFLIFAAIVLLPIGLLIAAVALVVRRVLRGRKSPMEGPSGPPPPGAAPGGPSPG
ncbi:MAG TPA: DUF4349 domain-containing protein [Thermoanaerobaculia bacterium]